MVEAKIDTDKKIFFIAILALLVFGIGRAYAYFSAQANTEQQTVTTGTLKVDIQNNGVIRAENISPISTSKMFEDATKLNFTIDNTGTIDLNARIILNITNITEELKSYDFKWALYNEQNKINEGTFLDVGSELEIANAIPILATKSQTYDLYIWIEETGFPQNELQNGTLEAKIAVNATQ